MPSGCGKLDCTASSPGRCIMHESDENTPSVYSRGTLSGDPVWGTGKQLNPCDRPENTGRPVRRIGRHMPTNSKPVKAAQIAQQLGCNTIQIFASNPTGWRPTADNPKMCAAFAQATHDCNLAPVVIHAPYLINLASPDK